VAVQPIRTATGGRDHLRDQVRDSVGRDREPTGAIIDSQSVRAAETVARASRGYDAGKKVNGRKRHIVVDTSERFLIVYLPAEGVLDLHTAGCPLGRKYPVDRLRIAVEAAEVAVLGPGLHFRLQAGTDLDAAVTAVVAPCALLRLHQCRLVVGPGGAVEVVVVGLLVSQDGQNTSMFKLGYRTDLDVDSDGVKDFVGFLRLTCVQISLPPLNPGSIDTGYTVAGSVSISCDGTTVSEVPSRCTGRSSTRRGT
jgi:hypothetical protein